MGFIQMLTNNFWTMVVLLIFVISIVSIIGGFFMEAYKTSERAREKRMELRNEELRLQLKLEQQKKENLSGPFPEDHPQPRDPSWEEQSQIHYGMGYQQQK